MIAHIEIDESRHVDDKTGRTVITFIPVFRPDVLAKGELKFAIWQAWEDEPETHEFRKDQARRNAAQVLRRFAEDTSTSIARVEGSFEKASCVWLANGMKIRVGRDLTTKGPAWLTVVPTDDIKGMNPQA